MGNLRNIPVEMSPFLKLKFVWFGVSLVASILTNGYKATARNPFRINLGVAWMRQRPNFDSGVSESV